MTAERTILIVDDEDSVRSVLGRMLVGPDRRVMVARDGVEALALTAEHAPDLIVLDVHMPKLNGWEVLSALRRRARTSMIPVILLTSASSPSDKIDGLTLGADDYVTKPFAGSELRARVEGLLRRHEQLLAANPLTGLPGTPAIEAEVERRLREKTPFAFFYIDIDRFKTFHDAYGFAAGDRAILKTAALIRRCFAGGFVGHIGGDDFVAIDGVEEAPYAAQRLATLFDACAPRLARSARRPFPTLSIGVVTTQQRAFASYAEVAAAAAKLKASLKARSSRKESLFSFDRALRPAPRQYL